MRLIGLFSTIILARLLTPADFGVIAIALIVVGLLETVAYTGVDLALMRSDTESREHYDTAWTIQLIQGAIIAALLEALAPWVGAFFSEPRATAVVQVIAIRSLISGLQNIGTVAFRKDLDFAKDFRFNLYKKLLNFFVIVGAAYWLRSYWALVIGMTSSAILEVVLSFTMHPYRPRVSLRHFRQIWNFSQWLIVSRVGSFLSRKTDEFIIGRLLGTTAMGGYHVASELATMPNVELVMPLRRALFPTLSKAAGDPTQMAQLFLLSFSAIAALCFSVSFGLWSIGPQLVPLVLGSKWLSTIGTMRWLALYGGISALVLALEVLLWVTGHTHRSAIQTWLELILLFPALYFAAQAYGIEGAAMARVGTSILVVPVMILLTARCSQVRQRQLYGAFWRPLAAAIAMAAVLELMPATLAGSIAAALAMKVIAGVLLYPTALFGLWWLVGRPKGFEANAVRALHGILGNRR